MRAVPCALCGNPDLAAVAVTVRRSRTLRLLRPLHKKCLSVHSVLACHDRVESVNLRKLKIDKTVHTNYNYKRVVNKCQKVI